MGTQAESWDGLTAKPEVVTGEAAAALDASEPGELAEGLGSGGDKEMRWHGYVMYLVISQGFNAGTNFLLVILLARSLTAHAFGVAALTLTIYPLTLSLFRGASLEPAIVHGGGWRALGFVRNESVKAAAVCTLIAEAIWVLAGGSLVVGLFLAIGSGAAVLEEGARWLLSRDNFAQGCAAADLMWAVVQISLLTLGPKSGVVVSGSWAAGGCISVLVSWGLVRRRVRLRADPMDEPTRAELAPRRYHHRRNWIRRNWNWGMEHLTSASTPQLILLLVPLTGGVRVSGAISAGLSLCGVATVLAGGSHQIAAGRLNQVRTMRDMRLWAVVIALALGVVVAVTTVPLLLIPDAVGVKLLGDTWELARAALPWIVLQKIASSMAFGPIVVTRRLPTYRLGVWMRIPVTTATVVGAVVAAALAGAVGAAEAFAVGAVASVVIWSVMFWHLTSGELREELLSGKSAS